MKMIGIKGKMNGLLLCRSLVGGHQMADLLISLVDSQSNFSKFVCIFGNHEILEICDFQNYVLTTFSLRSFSEDIFINFCRSFSLDSAHL